MSSITPDKTKDISQSLRTAQKGADKLY